MNRAQRRAAAKATPAYKRGLTREDKIKLLYKNGITAEDLKHDYQKGYTQGYSDGVESAMVTCYAALCLALNELHRFGRERCYRVMKAMDDKIIYNITSDEVAEEALQKMGIRFNVNEPMNRIEMTST